MPHSHIRGEDRYMQPFWPTLLTSLLLFLSCFSQAWSDELQNASIKIGVPTSLTGIYKNDAQGYRQSLAFAVDEINAEGGLLGKKLTMVPFDIGVFSPEKLLTAAMVLVEQEHVDTVQGGWSGWGQNVAAFGRYSVPTFFADASISSIKQFRKDPKKYNNIFQMCDVEEPLAVGVLDMMRGLNYSYPNNKVVIIASNDDWGYKVRDAMEKNADSKGWRIAMSEAVPYGISKWEPLLQKIREINPAWIHLEVANPNDIKSFLTQFSQKPTQSLINLGYGLVQADLLKTLGPHAEGLLGKVVFTIPLPDGTNAASKKWLQRFKKRYGTVPSAAGYLSYVSLRMWAEAVKKVGDEKNYPAINKELTTMHYRGIEGGIWHFDSDHKIPMSKDTPLLGLQIQNGRLVTICKVANSCITTNPFIKPPWIH